MLDAVGSPGRARASPVALALAHPWRARTMGAFISWMRSVTTTLKEALAALADAFRAPSEGNPFRLAELEHAKLPVLKWICPDYICEGLTLFAGKPKIGKSWWALALALAAATGGEFLGIKLTVRGPVLYCGLEDGRRRMQNRVRKLLGVATGWPAEFEVQHQLEAIDAGGVAEIEAWLDEHSNARLVIVDTLGKVRGQKNKTETEYQYDYRVVGALQELATKRAVAIILIHHVRKADADDVLDTVSGADWAGWRGGYGSRAWSQRPRLSARPAWP